MQKLKTCEEGYGRQVYDFVRGIKGHEIVERDDGFVDVSGGAPSYLAEFPAWPARQRKAIRFARGRVLDVGCGAGRVCLYLQRKGHDVLGIDISPLTVKVARMRGVKKAKAVALEDFAAPPGTFTTIVMFGNNFGLFGGFEKARRLLKRFYKMTTPDARIIAESNDPYATKVHEHLDYQKANRARGRMSGQLRIRIRYRRYATPWFDYLLASHEEMREIVKGTGWKVSRFIEDCPYVGIIVKEK